MTSKLTRTVCAVMAAGMLATAPALAADPTDEILYIAGELTAQYDLPAGLILAVCETESDFDQDCRTGSCVGLMQIHSAYAGSFARAAGLESYDLTDPEDNMRIGAYLLADYLDRYQGDIHFALMCYNLGEAGALRKLASGAESTGYSRKVVGRIEKWAEAGLPAAEEAPRAPENAGSAPRDIMVFAAKMRSIGARMKEVLFR